jgi:hypothetical protein
MRCARAPYHVCRKGYLDSASNSLGTPIETQMTLELFNHPGHYANTEALTCRL